MSRLQRLREQVDQRRAAAVDEIFGLFESAMAECEEEMTRSREENTRLTKLLNAASNREVRLQTVIPVDLKEYLVQEDRSPSPDQKEPKPPRIKKPKKEKAQPSQLRHSQTEKNKEAESQRSNSSEDTETESGGEKCTGPELAKNLDPGSHLQAACDGDDDDKSSDSSEPETEDSEDELN